MFQCFIHVWEIILKLYLLRIASDEPELKPIIPAGEIVITEFETIVHPVDSKTLLGPLSYISVYRFEIRNRENIPPFANLDRYKNMIALESLEGNHHVVKQRCIKKKLF